MEKQPLQNMTNKTEFNISVLLPTRGRQEPLEACIKTLLDTAYDPSSIEILIAFDDDDVDSIAYFENTIVPWLDTTAVSYTALKFKRLGYIRLNEYLNTLAKHATGKWYFFWNDDAVMKTSHWDKVINSHTGKLRLLRAETNHQHPYAIFPIVPKEWVEITGHLSPHQINDAWLSQVGWMLDIVETIPVFIDHERFDLTGKNNDDTFQNRPQLENIPGDPRDFNSLEWREYRLREAVKLAEHIEKVENRQLTHFRDSMAGKIDIWDKMLAIDIHGRMQKFENAHYDSKRRPITKQN